MKALVNQLRKLSANESGATAIEYGLICSLIVIGLVVGISSIGEIAQADMEAVKSAWGG